MPTRSHKNDHHGHKTAYVTLLGIIVAILLSRMPFVMEYLEHIGTLGYVGAFFAGMLFVISFTVATGALILFVLAEHLHPIELALIAGMGATTSDVLIFLYAKRRVSHDLEDLYHAVDRKYHLKHLMHKRTVHWMLPVIGAILLASPLPDELGASLMGLSHMKTSKFIVVSFLLNAIGIFLVVSAAALL